MNPLIPIPSAPSWDDAEALNNLLPEMLLSDLPPRPQPDLVPQKSKKYNTSKRGDFPIGPITEALCRDDPEALKELFPLIYKSEFRDEYIQNVLAQAAAYGHDKCYELIAGEVFEHPHRHYEEIGKTIYFATHGGHEWIANDLRNRVGCYLRDVQQDNAALCSAVNANNVADARRILVQNRFPRSLLDRALSIVCTRGHVDMVEVIVDSLMREDGTITIQHRVERGKLLERHLRKSTQNMQDSITAVLLPPYLDCFGYSPRGQSADQRLLEKVRDEAYAAIPRQVCFRLLSTEIPPLAEQGLLHRLRNDPKDLRLSAEGTTFQAHKDVLSYWSPYFAALSKNQYADSQHVEFGEDVSAASLQAILDFAYSGTYSCHALGVTRAKRNVELKALQIAADYFGMNRLQQEVKKVWLETMHLPNYYFESLAENSGELDPKELRKRSRLQKLGNFEIWK